MPKWSGAEKLTSIAKSAEGGGQFVDGFQEYIGFGGAEALLGGERAEDSDCCAYASAAGHLQVLGGVADIDGFARFELHVAQGQAQWSGMGFAKAGVAAADVGGEVVPQSEVAELAVDAVAIAAGDQAEDVAAGELRKDAARTGEQLRPMVGVMLAPNLVGSAVFCAREVGGAIDVVPVWRVVGFEFGKTPGNIQFTEHGEVGGGVGRVGVEQGAIPIEQDATER